MRYRALEAGTTPRNISVCFAVLVGSYIASGLVNATTVTQPTLRTPRSHVVIVSPAIPARADDLFPPDIPPAEPAPELAEAPATHTL